MLAREAPGLHQESVLLLFDITGVLGMVGAGVEFPLRRRPRRARTNHNCLHVSLQTAC